MIVSPSSPDNTRDRSRSPLRCTERCGVSLIEVFAAIALMGTVMAVLIPVLSRTTGLRRQVEQREEALSMVSNLLERAELLPSVTLEGLQPLADQLSAECRVKSPQWKITVVPETSPAMNRVDASLSWEPHTGQRSSVTLVRWYTGGTP